MLDIKEIKKSKLSFEQLDAETKEYVYDLFRRYIVRKKISDNSKELTTLFARKLRTNDPRQYSLCFNEFNNRFANANLIAYLEREEHSTNFLKNMKEDQFNLYLERCGGSFERKIALICFSRRPSERIANRVDFPVMQAYADMQDIVIQQLKQNPTSSISSILLAASQAVRTDFNKQNGYKMNSSKILRERVDYKSLGKKCASVWQDMLEFYREFIDGVSVSSNAMQQFVGDTFVFTKKDQKAFKKSVEESSVEASRYVSETRANHEVRMEEFPEYYDYADEEISSCTFEEDVQLEHIKPICLKVFDQLLREKIFEELKAKQKQ